MTLHLRKQIRRSGSQHCGRGNIPIVGFGEVLCSFVFMSVRQTTGSKLAKKQKTLFQSFGLPEPVKHGSSTQVSGSSSHSVPSKKSVWARFTPRGPSLYSYVTATAGDAREARVYHDDHVTIIRDRYPKSRYHFLVLANRPVLSIYDLSDSRQDLDLIDTMSTSADKFIEKLKKEDGKCELVFLKGFHAVPSMKHLHVHILTNDLEGAYMKTRKHWNSFTSEYLVTPERLREAIQKHGSWPKEDIPKHELLLKGPLHCNLCGEAFPQFAVLAEHRKLCRKGSNEDRS